MSRYDRRAGAAKARHDRVAASGPAVGRSKPVFAPWASISRAMVPPFQIGTYGSRPLDRPAFVAAPNSQPLGGPVRS